MQLQAAIASLHAEPTAATADWPQIGPLYAELAKLKPASVVVLNYAVAVAMSDLAADAGPERGLRIVDELEAGGELDRYHRPPPHAPICCAGVGISPKRPMPAVA